MKNIVGVIFFIGSVFLFANCGESNKKTTEESESLMQIVVDADDCQSVDFNEISKNVKYIQLETNSQCLLKSIDKVQIYNDKIYVYNFMGDGGNLFCFDMDGKYLFTVGTRGQGPGEYVVMSDFEIDKRNNLLWVGDDAKKIMKFDLNGNFIEQFKTEFSIRKMKPSLTDKDVMAIHLGYYKDNEDLSFILYSLKEKSILFSKTANSLIQRSFSMNVFFEYQDEIRSFRVFKDTVFSIGKSKIEPILVVDFGKRSIPKDLLNDKSTRNIQSQFSKPENKYAGLMSDGVETSDYFMFSYNFSGASRKAIYSKHFRKTLNVSEVVIDGKTVNNAGRYFFNFYQNNKFISFLPAHLLIENNETNSNIQKQQYGCYSNISDLLSNLKEDDNPILILSDENFANYMK